MHLFRVELGELGRSSYRVVEAAECVDQAKLARGTARPDAALGDFPDPFDRQFAVRRDDAGKLAVDILDARLDDAIELCVGPAENIGLTR